jgi:hypothetical protein
MPEPRDPLLKVLTIMLFTQTATFVQDSVREGLRRARARGRGRWPPGGQGQKPPAGPPKQHGTVDTGGRSGPRRGPSLSNDPSAGSPTETLLRLLLPLNDQV